MHKRYVVKATKGHRKCFLQADWLKTTDVISGVSVLPCPSSPHPPIILVSQSARFFVQPQDKMRQRHCRHCSVVASWITGKSKLGYIPADTRR